MQKTKMRNTHKLTKEELKAMRDEDNKPVKGIFRCFEPRGGSMSFYYKKHRGEEVQKYTMVDGETYEVPMGVAKHLNSDCWYPRHTYVLDAQGNPARDLGKKVQRCSFESLEFASVDEHAS